MRKLALIVLLAPTMPYASAQRPTSPPQFASSRSGAHVRPFRYPLAVFSDSLGSEAQVVSDNPTASRPSVIVLQAPPVNPAPEPLPSPAQSLLIELQGGRYIRVSGEEPASAGMIHEELGPVLNPVGSSTPVIPSLDLARAVLVFRDGHREEVTAYTIADGVLYAQGNYYTDGSWNRKIELSWLNLPETIEACHTRGVNFRLPTAPNEVVTRP